MKRNLLTILGVLLALVNTIGAFANTSSAYLNTYKKYKRCLVRGSAERIAWDDETPQPYTFVTKSTPKPTDEESLSLSVYTSKESELENVIGDKLLKIESLTVTGPINDDDFTTMWRATFEGNLQYINLKDAVVKSGEVPSNAFFLTEQIDSEGYLYVIKLKEIILPENITTIGEFAFCYAVNLESINIPASLNKLGRSCFCDCYSLNFDVLSLPEGMETIERSTFGNCSSLESKVELPSTIKRIESSAFMSSKITAINLPEGLQSIGDGAFYGTALRDVYVPDGCAFKGYDHFAQCHELRSARLPEGMTIMPSGLFDSCIVLEDVNIPESVTELESYAISFCFSLRALRLPPFLKSSEFYSLFYMESLEEICFPATMEVIGEQSCKYWRDIKRIYCAAPIPPVCIGEEKEPLQTPFGIPTFDPELQTPRETPVYVPRGSAEAYRNAWGWNYFTNFIETDEFPSSEVAEINSDVDSENLPMYDLYGRKVTEPQKGQIYIKGGKKFVQN